MPKGLEIERKFLIALPSEDRLLAEGAVCDDITQTYLLSEAGVTARVRRREGAVGVEYTHTEKRCITAITAREDERIIDREEYAVLLKTADPDLSPIRKRRYSLPYGGRLLEIDVYPFWERTAVLEVELPTEDAPLTLPPYLTVIAEVTEDKRYKNVSLAAKVPEEPNPDLS